jgi:CRISPR-associated protein Csb2
MDLDADGHLDHILLWAPMGFGHAAMAAIRGLRRTWMKGGAEELRIALAGQGVQDNMEAWPEGMERYLNASRVWKTLTPFVPPRFVKKTGSNSPEGQIRAELASRQFPAPDRVEIHAYPSSGDLDEMQATHFRHYIRRRTRGGNPPPQDLGWFVRLTFPAPVQGPICLGYGGHFGLGLFQMAPE